MSSKLSHVSPLPLHGKQTKKKKNSCRTDSRFKTTVDHKCFQLRSTMSPSPRSVSPGSSSSAHSTPTAATEPDVIDANNNGDVNTELLEDVFGEPNISEMSTATSTTTITPRSPPSAITAVRRHLATDGYREGIATGKTGHVQRGFDAGFPAGAALGMRAGSVLGILEGIVLASQVQGEEEARESALAALLARARQDLGAVGALAEAEDEDAQDGEAEEHPADGNEHTAATAAIAQLEQCGDAVISRWERVVARGH